MMLFGKTLTAAASLCAAFLLAGCISLPHLGGGSTDLNTVRLERAVDYNEDNVHARYLLGKAALEQGDSAQATVQFRRAIALKAEFEEAWQGLGIALLDEGKFREAEKSYADMTTKFPQSAAAQAGRAAAAYAGEKMDDARTYAGQALALDPASAEALRVLGEIEYAEGNYAKALESWKAALKANPSLHREYSPLVKDLEGYLAKYH